MLRVFHHYLSGRRLAFFTAESLAIAVGCGAGAVAVPWLFGRGAPTSPRVAWEMAGFLLVLQFLLYASDLYDLRIAAEPAVRLPRLVRVAGLVALAAGAVALRWHASSGALLGGAVGACAGALFLRGALGTWGERPRRVLVLGTGRRAQALRLSLRDQGDEAYALEQADPAGESLPLLGMARRARAEAVVLALDEPRGAVSAQDLLACRFAGIRVFEAGGFCERVLRRLPLAHLRSSYLCFSDEPALGPIRAFMKRAFDVAAAACFLALASPVIALVALLVRLDSPGPVFYGQERVGRGGRPYRLWKFRSMRQDAEAQGAVWAQQNDDRVTRVGRFLRKARMDELPQLVNVLRGEMSFVGPRPERPVFVEKLAQEIPFYRLRESVKPGITGWAQIRYPYGASVEDARNKLELDLYYVKNGSLFLDVAILFHTVRHVLLGRGAR